MPEVRFSERVGRPKAKLQFPALLERLGPMLSPLPETHAKEKHSRQQQMETWLDVLSWQAQGNWFYSRVFVAGETSSMHEVRQKIMANIGQREQLCIVEENGEVTAGKSFAVTTLENEKIGYLQHTTARALKLEIKRGNEYRCFACESVNGTRDRVGMKIAIVRVPSEKEQMGSTTNLKKRFVSFAPQAHSGLAV